MGCYCGCGTVGNKIRWTLGILFMALGVAFLIAMLVRSSQKWDDYTECVDELERIGIISKSEADDARQRDFETAWDENDNIWIEACREKHLEDSAANAFFGLMVAFFVVGSIQFYIMCCCAKKPGECGGNSNQPQMVYAPHAQPTYAQPTYGQPVYDASNIQMSKV